MSIIESSVDMGATAQVQPIPINVLLMLEGGPLDGELQVVRDLPTNPGATLLIHLPSFQTFDPTAPNEVVLAQGLIATYQLVGPGPNVGDPNVPWNAGSNWTASYVFEFTGESYVDTPATLPPTGPGEPVEMYQVWMSATTTLVPDTLAITSEPVVMLAGQSALDIDGVVTPVRPGVVAMGAVTSVSVTPDWSPSVALNGQSSMLVSD